MNNDSDFKINWKLCEITLFKVNNLTFLIF